jgi:ABC-type sugar transport system substrate-binding protein
MTRLDKGLSRRSFFAGAAGAGAGLALAACSTSGGASAAPAAGPASAAASSTFTDADFAPLKGKKIGVVGINLQGPTVARSVQIMTDLSARHGFELQSVSSAFDLARTNDTMRVWSDAAFDAIVVANTEAANISEGLAAAAKAGVPVGGFYCGVAPGLAFDVGANEFISGNRCATYIQQRLAATGGNKGIAIFGYTPLANLRERELSVKTQADYYSIPILLRHEVNADASVPDVQNTTADLLTKYPKGGQLGAVFVGWDQGGFAAVSAIEAAGRDDVFVVSIDGEVANLDSIRQGGRQGATVVNDMVAVSNVVLAQLAAIIGGAEPPKNPQLYVDAPLVTTANIPATGIPEGTGLTPFFAG